MAKRTLLLATILRKVARRTVASNFVAQTAAPSKKEIAVVLEARRRNPAGLFFVHDLVHNWAATLADFQGGGLELPVNLTHPGPYYYFDISNMG
jgi:hypothetical protein